MTVRAVLDLRCALPSDRGAGTAGGALTLGLARSRRIVMIRSRAKVRTASGSTLVPRLAFALGAAIGALAFGASDSGAAPVAPVVAENALPGTPSWRFP